MKKKKKKKAAFQYFLTPSAPYSRSLSIQRSHDNSSEVTRALSALRCHRKISMKWLLHVQWLFCINFLCEYFYSALEIFTPPPFEGMNQQLKEIRYSISSTASSFMMFLNGLHWVSHEELQTSYIHFNFEWKHLQKLLIQFNHSAEYETWDNSDELSGLYPVEKLYPEQKCLTFFYDISYDTSHLNYLKYEIYPVQILLSN